MSLNPLERRIIELSYANKLTHVSSCLNCVNVLSDIYDERGQVEPVCLCNGHAGLALYVVLEAKGLCDAQKMIEKHGVHPNRDIDNGIWISSGSLGAGEPIAVGMAFADRTRHVYLITSDGSCAEGSVWEAFHLASDLRLTNLKVHVIANGLGAYRETDTDVLRDRLDFALWPIPFEMHVPQMPFPWLEGLVGHYMTISDEQFAEAMA